MGLRLLTFWKDSFFFGLCVHVCVWEYVYTQHTCRCPCRSQEGVGFPGTRLTDRWKSLDKMLVPELGSSSRAVSFPHNVTISQPCVCSFKQKNRQSQSNSPFSLGLAQQCCLIVVCHVSKWHVFPTWPLPVESWRCLSRVRMQNSHKMRHVPVSGAIFQNLWIKESWQWYIVNGKESRMPFFFMIP